MQMTGNTVLVTAEGPESAADWRSRCTGSATR